MDMQKLRDVLRAEGVVFSFSGTISQDILTSIAEAMERRMETQGVSARTVNNIFAVFVELMQNVMNYSRERSAVQENVWQSPGIAIVGVSGDGEGYYVASGNVIDKASKGRLVAALDKLNAMDEEGLKDYYRSLRRSGQNKHERGAGLGFLEMRRKAASPLEYTISDIDDVSAFFSIKVCLR